MFQIDTLSFTFLLLIVMGVLPNIIYSFGYLPHIKRKGFYLFHYFGFIISMGGVVVASTGITFLIFWELMSLTSWQLILTEVNSKDTIKAARFYFFMTHLGFIALLFFFIIISNNSLNISFLEMGTNAKTFKYPALLFFFLSFGFLSKAGAVPLHVWLPYAHPEAPSPVSALMSGVMLKVAIYGLFRFLFVVLYPWPLEWGIIILIIGGISAVVGVLYALSEHDIKALLANHSIENIGIILIGFGMGMIFDSLGLKTLSSFAFIAAIFHSFNHMSFKSLLFMSAGSVLHQTHTKNMEKYGGLIKSMPITALTFLIAAISISALPPSNGFLSEWMIFQSLLSSHHIDLIALKLTIPFAVFALALTGGLAIACFVKAYGITFLGLHRSENVKHAKEVNLLMVLGMILMALVVISLMLFTPKYLELFDSALIFLGRPSIYGQMYPNGIWSLHSIGVNGGIVSPIILLGALVGITALLMISYKIFNVKERIYHTWGCGYRTGGRTQYSATGFAGPVRRFFSWIYRPNEHFKKEIIMGHKTKYEDAHFEVHVKPLFEKTLYLNIKKISSIISQKIYGFYTKNKTHSTMIFNVLLLMLLFHRIMANGFSWIPVILDLIIIIISIKLLIFGEKK